jgi:hypothetical protein
MDKPPTPAPPRPVTEGDRFRHVDEHGDRLLEVIGVFCSGNTARVTCLLVDPEPDYADQVEFAIVGREAVEAALVRRRESWEQIESESNAYLGSLDLGTVLHYRADPGRYLRGTLVLDDRRYGDLTQRVFLPTAMVGSWEQDQVASYGPAGEVVLGAWARAVVERAAREVSSRDVFESPTYRRRPDEADPATLPAWSFTPPALPDAEREARILLAEMAKVLSGTGVATERVAAARALLDA